MKTRKQKQQELESLAQQFREATSGVLIGFNKVTVEKDQAFRRSLREVGAQYRVVKTLSRGLRQRGRRLSKRWAI